MGRRQGLEKIDQSAVAKGARKTMPEDSRLKPRVIVPGGQRLPPPPELTELERKFWVETMAGMPAGWFGIETLPLLRLLCRYSAISEIALNAINAAEISKLSTKEFRTKCALADRAANMMMRISIQLQLTPKSRGEYHSSKKDSTSSRTNPVRPWEIAIDDRNGGARTS
jgi:hypothetical protein